MVVGILTSKIVGMSFGMIVVVGEAIAVTRREGLGRDLVIEVAT